MARKLPSPELSVNLLREIADGIERESGRNAPDAMPVPERTGTGEPENVAREVASKIAGNGFKDRVSARRQKPDETVRTDGQNLHTHRPRKNSRTR